MPPASRRVGSTGIFPANKNWLRNALSIHLRSFFKPAPAMQNTFPTRSTSFVTWWIDSYPLLPRSRVGVRS